MDLLLNTIPILKIQHTWFPQELLVSSNLNIHKSNEAYISPNAPLLSLLVSVFVFPLTLRQISKQSMRSVFEFIHIMFQLETEPQLQGRRYNLDRL